jgi:hypothetical protein
MHSTATELVLAKKEAVALGQLDMASESNDIMNVLLFYVSLDERYMRCMPTLPSVKGNLMAEEGMFLTDDELVGKTG